MKKKDELSENANGCLAKANDDEMLFILRAQDVSAHIIPKMYLIIGLKTFTNLKNKTNGDNNN